MKQTTFLYYLLCALIMVIIFTRCTRKLHTTRSETTTQDTQGHTVDSMSSIIRTLSEAYESLLQSTSGTEVEFKCPDCGPNQAAMPRVTIKPDGTKEFTGVSKFNDNTSKSEKQSFTRQQIIDSMNSVHKSDTAAVVVRTVQTERVVKVSVMPWYVWLIFGILAVLWLNERFGVVKIPLLTKL